MPLDFQLVQAPFRFGIEEGIDPKQVPVGTLTRAENVVWLKSGRLQKRYGITNLVRTVLGGSDISEASRLLVRDGQLGLISSNTLYTYSVGLSQWLNIDRVPEVGVTSSTLIDPITSVSAVDIANYGDFIVHAWISGDPQADVAAFGTPYVQIVDRVTGERAFRPTFLSTGTTYCGVRVVVIGTTAIIVTMNLTSNDIEAFTINLTTMAFGASATLRNDAATNSTSFDVAISGANFVLAYENSANALKLYSYNTSLVQQASGGITGEGTLTGTTIISIAGVEATNELLALGYYVPATSKVRYANADDSTLAQVIAPVDVETGVTNVLTIGICRFDSANSVVAFTKGDYKTTSYKVSNMGTAPATLSRTTYGVRLVSKPFMMGTKCFALVQDDPPVWKADTMSVILVEIETSTNAGIPAVPFRYVAKVEHAIGARQTRGFLTQVPAISSTEFVAAVPFFGSLAPIGVDLYWQVGTRLVTITIGSSAPKDMWKSVEYAREAYISAGVLAVFDGRHVFDANWESAPYLALTVGAGGSGNMAAGNYIYAIVSEYKSSVGVLHRSPPAFATATSVPATGSVLLDVTSYQAGLKQDFATGFDPTAAPSIAAIYRSVVTGTTYYRRTVAPSFGLAKLNSSSDVTQFTDTVADTDIGGGILLNTRPQIYTSGGVLIDEQPPAFTTLHLHKNRLWGIGPDERTIWFSKSFQDDIGTAPGFSINFRLVFDQRLVALATLDDKLIVFTVTGIWYVEGDGPDRTGANPGLSSPQPVQTDVGCLTPRSICEGPEGVFFQANDGGLYMLSRGLEVVWVGKPVQDQLDTYSTITSAVLVSKYNQVRFTCNGIVDDVVLLTEDDEEILDEEDAELLTETVETSGIVLVYDYVEKQWSTFVYTTTSLGYPIADALMYNGVYTFVTTDGWVYQESEETYVDRDDAWITSLLETAWWHANGPLNYQSVRNFRVDGLSRSNHDLSISVAFNGATAYQQGPRTWNAGVDGVTAVGPIETAHVSIGTRRKCRSIRFKIEDATPTDPGSYPVGTGQGFILDMMGIEVGMKKGLGRLPATQRK